MTAGADARATLADLRGQPVEKEAEIERLKKALYGAKAEKLQRRAKRSRPDTLRGTTYRLETPLGTMFTNTTEDDRGQPFEVFIMLGKAGGQRDGRRRGHGADDLPGASLGHPAPGDSSPAPRHLVRPGGGSWPA